MPPAPYIARVAYYEQQAQALYERYGRSVTQFARAHESLFVEGERRLCACEATGYNLVPDPIPASHADAGGIVMYAEAIYHPHHFGLLLAMLERDGLIQAQQVHFTVRTTTVLYEGWATEAPKRTIQRRDLYGTLDHHLAIDYVETLLTMTPACAVHAQGILTFLNQHTRRQAPDALPDSPEYPDIRMILPPDQRVPVEGFTPIVANTLRHRGGQLVVLRQQTRFEKPWEQTAMAINCDVARYVAGFGVPA